MKDNKPIFKKSKAFKLISMGNELVDVIPNDRNPKYLIFYFRNTVKLNKDIESLQVGEKHKSGYWNG